MFNPPSSLSSSVLEFLPTFILTIIFQHPNPDLQTRCIESSSIPGLQAAVLRAKVSIGHPLRPHRAPQGATGRHRMQNTLAGRAPNPSPQGATGCHRMPQGAELSDPGDLLQAYSRSQNPLNRVFQASRLQSSEQRFIHASSHRVLELGGRGGSL